MPVSRFKIKWSILSAVVCLCLFGFVGRSLAQPHDSSILILERMVIDPGHGGSDLGIVGQGGLTESGVTIALARQFQQALEKEMGLTVYLTRDQGGNPSITDRTGLANGIRAQLFLSIHTGGDTALGPGGFRIYFQDYQLLSGLAEWSTPDPGDTPPAETWAARQAAHLPSSYRLAVELDEAVQDVLKVKSQGPEGAPLAVLAGADQPAVLIEFGALTDPESERRLGTAGFREALARAIVNGIKSWRTWLEDNSENP